MMRSLKVLFLGRCKIQVIISNSTKLSLHDHGDIIFNHILTCESSSPCWTDNNPFVLPKLPLDGKIVAVSVSPVGLCRVIYSGNGELRPWIGAVLRTTGKHGRL